MGEVDSYGGRLIPILNILFKGPDNVLILERPPDETLCNYFRHEPETEPADAGDLESPRLRGAGPPV